MKTAKQIASDAERFNGRANIAAINRAYREQDESSLWPIRGRFNVTERAIRRVRRLNREGLGAEGGLEYCLVLESVMSEIINNEDNW